MTAGSSITLQGMPVLAGCEDREGYLILADGILTAVIVRLDSHVHDGIAGKWFLEAGFGPCRDAQELFETPEAAVAWVSGRVLN